ncbi:MAG: guanylate kinase [Fusobacteriaceae bacterium]|nr:guanylate kinase [Fusobacteriaceae bacterium]
MAKGNLFVVSGPSGSGKTTVCERVRDSLGIGLSVSATTRKPRKDERDGVKYHFMDEAEFEARRARGEFLETNCYNGNWYGTLLSEVRKYTDRGRDLILEIDVNGGMQVREKCPEARMIFFRPPSMEDLEARLRNRATDDEETIQSRLRKAEEELPFESAYDMTVVNHTIEQACEDLTRIILGERRGGNDEKRNPV